MGFKNLALRYKEINKEEEKKMSDIFQGVDYSVP